MALHDSDTFAISLILESVARMTRLPEVDNTPSI